MSSIGTGYWTENAIAKRVVYHVLLLCAVNIWICFEQKSLQRPWQVFKGFCLKFEAILFGGVVAVVAAALWQVISKRTGSWFLIKSNLCLVSFCRHVKPQLCRKGSWVLSHSKTASPWFQSKIVFGQGLAVSSTEDQGLGISNEMQRFTESGEIYGVRSW